MESRFESGLALRFRRLIEINFGLLEIILSIVLELGIDLVSWMLPDKNANRPKS